MSNVVTVVDYGIGNIFSVTRALEKCGASTRLTADPKEIAAASRLVLPGVGAFSNGMQGLRDRNLIEPLRAYAKTDRPLLGICLGMQMLFSESSEFGRHEGLAIIDGLIESIEPKDENSVPMKVPHIGWSPLVRPAACESWNGTILETVRESEYAYFVHTYTAAPADEAHRLADTYYGSSRISAAVKKGNTYGCQFHPEKSGEVGLRIIQAFLNC